MAKVSKRVGANIARSMKRAYAPAKAEPAKVEKTVLRKRTKSRTKP